MGKLAIIGDYDSGRPTHVATNESIRHVEGVSEFEISREWIGTSALSDTVLDNFQGIWIAPGPTYENLRNCISAIKEFFSKRAMTLSNDDKALIRA